MSFEERIGAVAVVGICFAGQGEEDWIVGEVVMEEEVVVRAEGLLEFGFGIGEDGVVTGVDLLD